MQTVDDLATDAEKLGLFHAALMLDAFFENHQRKHNGAPICDRAETCDLEDHQRSEVGLLVSTIDARPGWTPAQYAHLSLPIGALEEAESQAAQVPVP